MGGVQSKQQKIERYNKIHPNKWEKTGQEGITQFAIDENGREGQINVIKLDPTRKIDDELEVYYYRRTFEGPLVKCYGAQALKGKAPGVCGVDNSMKVITQRIIKRWRQLPQLTFPQALYSLDQALQGYKVLFGQVGPFQVNHSMLGINNDGDLHVWLNQNFADNNPSLERGVLYTTANSDKLFGVNNEADMVDNIYRVIESKCEQGKFPKEFSDQFAKQNGTFNTALQAIDYFVAIRRLEVPNKIHPNSKMMYVSKTKGLPLSSNIKSTTSNYDYKNQTSSPLRSNEISPYRNTSNNYSNMSSPGDALKRQTKEVWEKQKQFNLGNQAVFNTTYIKPGENKSKQKQKSIATPKYASFGGNQGSPNSSGGYLPGGYQTGGYQTGPTRGDENKYEWETKNYSLRENPNINAAESVYEPKQTTPPPSWIKGESGASTPIKYTQSGATVGIVPITNANMYSNAPIATQGISKTPMNITFSSGAPISTTTYTSYNMPVNASLTQNSTDAYKLGTWNIPAPTTTIPPFKNDVSVPTVNYEPSSNINTHTYKETSFQYSVPTANIPATSATNTIYTNPTLFQKPKTNFSYNYTPGLTGAGTSISTGDIVTGAGSRTKPNYSNPQITSNTINNTHKTYATSNDVVSTTGNFILASGNIAPPPASFGSGGIATTMVTTTYGPTTTYNKDVYSASPNTGNKNSQNIQTSQVTRQF